MKISSAAVREAALDVAALESLPPHEAFAQLATLVWPNDPDAHLVASAARGHREAASSEELETRAEAAREAIEAQARRIAEVEDQGVIARALKQSRKVPWLDWLTRTLEKAEVGEESRPLRVAVLGTFSAGKSSLINAWIGQPLLSVGDIPVTARTTTLRYGAEPKALIHLRDGSIRELSLDEARDAADQRKTTKEQEGGSDPVEYIEIEYPSEQLRGLELVDTPGFNSGHHAHGIVTAEIIKQADVVLWIFNATKPGADLEARELEIIQHTTARVVGVVNGIDLISRPSYPTKPEQYKRLAKWEEHLKSAVDAVRRACGESISTFITTSTPWIEEEHPRSGRDELHRIIDDAARDSSELMEQAREKRRVDSRRLSQAFLTLREKELHARTATASQLKAQSQAYLENLKATLDDIDQINGGTLKNSQSVSREISAAHAIAVDSDLLRIHHLSMQPLHAPMAIETWGDFEDFAERVFSTINLTGCDVEITESFEIQVGLLSGLQVKGDEGIEWRYILRRLKNIADLNEHAMGAPDLLFSVSNIDDGARLELLRVLGRFACRRRSGPGQVEMAGLGPIQKVLTATIAGTLRTALSRVSMKLISIPDWRLPGCDGNIDIRSAVTARPWLLLGCPGSGVVPAKLVDSLRATRWTPTLSCTRSNVVEHRAHSVAANWSETTPLRDLIPALAEAFEMTRAEAVEAKAALEKAVDAAPSIVAPYLARAMSGVFVSNRGLFYERRLPAPDMAEDLVGVDDIMDMFCVNERVPQKQEDPAFSKQLFKLKRHLTLTAQHYPPHTRQLRALLAADLRRLLKRNDRGASNACRAHMLSHEWICESKLEPEVIRRIARPWFRVITLVAATIAVSSAWIWSVRSQSMLHTLREGALELSTNPESSSFAPLALSALLSVAVFVVGLWSWLQRPIETRYRAYWTLPIAGALATGLLLNHWGMALLVTSGVAVALLIRFNCNSRMWFGCLTGMSAGVYADITLGGPGVIGANLGASSGMLLTVVSVPRSGVLAGALLGALIASKSALFLSLTGAMLGAMLGALLSIAAIELSGATINSARSGAFVGAMATVLCLALIGVLTIHELVLGALLIGAPSGAVTARIGLISTCAISGAITGMMTSFFSPSTNGLIIISDLTTSPSIGVVFMLTVVGAILGAVLVDTTNDDA